MHPLVRGAAAAALLTALGRFDRSPPPPDPGEAPKTDVRGVDGLPAPCGPGTLPEGPVCIRIPGEADAQLGLLEDSPAPRQEPRREVNAGDRIPRRPERVSDASQYVFPIGTPERPPRVV